MQIIHINIKNIVGRIALFSVVGLALFSAQIVRAADDYVQPPELPPACSNLQVSADNKLSRRVYATGVQIYKWNGASWDFVAPIANLYADENYRKEVGFHYAGPTWEFRGGGKIVGSRLSDCTPDPTAIPWLLLKAASNEGSGVFGKASYIQRVNTAGGLRPTTAGSFVGQEKRVPYTTEYYFYRSEGLFD